MCHKIQQDPKIIQVRSPKFISFSLLVSHNFSNSIVSLMNEYHNFFFNQDHRINTKLSFNEHVLNEDGKVTQVGDRIIKAGQRHAFRKTVS